MRLDRGAMWRLALLPLMGLAACSCAPEGVPATRAPQRDGSGQSSQSAQEEPGRRVVRVGNQAKGIEDQPDYDLQAIRIREQLEGRLPRPLPPAKAACTKMLDAAVAYYRAVEGADSTAVQTILATREADHAACERGTSPAASSCAAILLAEQTGEYPWVVDQCSRAFPK